MKRPRSLTIKAVPHVTSSICMDTFKDTPMWLLERLFPNDETQIEKLENSIFHLAALNYFATLAAKRHHEQALYVATWLEKAFKLWKYIDNAARHSFMRKQTRLAQCLIRGEEYDFSLHHIGVFLDSPQREFYDAVWPQIDITDDEAAELRGIIDQRQLDLFYKVDEGA